MKVRHWDPLKTVLRSGFEKHEQSMKEQSENERFIIVFKPLRSIEKQTLFLILGHLQR